MNGSVGHVVVNRAPPCRRSEANVNRHTKYQTVSKVIQRSTGQRLGEVPGARSATVGSDVLLVALFSHVLLCSTFGLTVAVR